MASLASVDNKKKGEQNYNDYDDTHSEYSEAPWKIISSYFVDQHLKRLVRHQIESYNDFIGVQIERTIGMFNPVMIASEQDFDKKNRKYKLEIEVNFDKFHLYRAQIHETTVPRNSCFLKRRV